MDFKILPFELKSASGDGSTFDGYANAFFNIDSAQEIVDYGAFADTLPQFLTDGFIGGLNHNWDSPIGSPVSAKEEAKGLFVEGKICPTTHGKDCMVLLKDRVVKKLSIGYRVLGDEYLADGEDVATYWQKCGYTPNPQDIARAAKGARLLTKLHLFEFSPVTVPANTMADITRVKRYDASEIETEREFERFLRDAGFAREAAKTISVSGFKALRQRDVEEAETPEETPPPETPEPEAEIPEAKEEEEPVAPPLVVSGVPQAKVQAAFIDFQDFKARYGLD